MKCKLGLGLGLSLMGILLLTRQAVAEPSWLAPFSSLSELAPDWQALTFPNIEQKTRYTLTRENGVSVVLAESDNSASGLIHKVPTLPTEGFELRWRWKISNVFQQGDARTKSGDDYPARLYVAFEFDPASAGFFERAKRKAAAVIFGEELPGNALNYLWSSTLPVGEWVANPYTDSTRMLAVNSGTALAGQWVSHRRNIAEDYRAAFGEEPPPIVGIAIMSDSDNTGERATAWYGDVELLRPEPKRSDHTDDTE